jgi:cytosine/uracil/thiamine/allantoin permease
MPVRRRDSAPTSTTIRRFQDYAGPAIWIAMIALAV